MKELWILVVLVGLCCASKDPSDWDITFHLDRTKIQYLRGEEGCNYDVVLALMIVVRKCAADTKFETSRCIEGELGELFAEQDWSVLGVHGECSWYMRYWFYDNCRVYFDIEQDHYILWRSK